VNAQPFDGQPVGAEVADGGGTPEGHGRNGSLAPQSRRWRHACHLGGEANGYDADRGGQRDHGRETVEIVAPAVEPADEAAEGLFTSWSIVNEPWPRGSQQTVGRRAAPAVLLSTIT
jgi:hypothetical protein